MELGGGPSWVIGLMSGTSMDGIDVAAIRTDGRTVELRRGLNGHPEPLGPTHERPFTADEKSLLVRAKEEAKSLADRAARPGSLLLAEELITRVHAEAVERFLAGAGIDRREIAAVGFHGQTVLHRPEAGLTVQLGDGQALADRLGLPVIYDLRAADIAAGGQGAPLVPVFHRALAEASGYELPLAILNIGGVANVTLIGPDDHLVGFDTGPGNALLDDLMRERTGVGFDENGEAAARGTADHGLLRWLLQHPYFSRRPPKSLDRDAFSHRMVGPLSLEDAAATLTAFTAAAVARALDWSDLRPRRWIVGGGGARNATMMRRLAEALGPDCDLSDADAIGWSSSHLEAQAFAYLAARSLAGLPITFPSTTGVETPLTGGLVARPR